MGDLDSWSMTGIKKEGREMGELGKIGYEESVQVKTVRM